MNSHEYHVVVVLGMHRSGTSAITRGLSAIGVNLGSRLIPAVAGNNEKGFFEDIDINAINDAILHALGHEWHSLTPVVPEELSGPVAQRFNARAVSLLRSRFEDTEILGIKDPRMPRLLPFWKSVFAQLQVRVSYIIACRNPLSVAQSLYRRDGFDREKSCFLWLDHTLAGVTHTAGCNRVVVDFDKLMSDPAVQLGRMADCLGLHFDPLSPGISEFMHGFLDDSLRHSSFRVDDLALDKAVPGGVFELYSALQELAADRSGFDSPLFGAMLTRLSERHGEMRPALAFMRTCDDEVADLKRMVCDHAGQIAKLKQAVVELNGRIGILNQAIAERDDRIGRLDQEVAERDDRIGRLDQQVAERDRQITGLNAVVTDYRHSTSWRITWPLRLVRGELGRVGRTASLVTNVLRRGGGVKRTVLTAVRIYKNEGICGIRHRLTMARVALVEPGAAAAYVFPQAARAAAPGGPDIRYNAWLSCNVFNEESAAVLRSALKMRAGTLPLISVIMPVHNTPVVLLERAISSVVDQVYENWELCITDDASSDSRTLDALRSFAGADPRIKVEFSRENGNISRATNIAAALAQGDFLAFLDHDDELTPDALAEVAIAVADNPEVDYLYSDEDKIDPAGCRFAPQFKPDWSPTLLLSYMYMGHVKVVRRALFQKLDGFRVGFEGSQDYDFALRMSEHARRVFHLPKVLYHWRVVPGSTAASGDAKPGSVEAGRRAVADAFVRRSYAAVVEQPKWAVDARVGIFAARFPHTGPRVSIIIPTKNRVDLLRRCIESIEKTAYADYELVIVDNGSDDPKTISYLESLPHKVLRIGDPPGQGFSFAYINNEAVRRVNTEFVLFLNNDTRVRSADWLSQLMGYARMDKVGAVGARLLFDDGTIQHAGIVHGYHDGMAGHAFRNTPSQDHGYLAYSMVAREYSAVTAACLLTPRNLYIEMGGFDQERFAVAYNDVDYCYRLVDSGFGCIYCATAELIHSEGKSRGFVDNPREIAYFRQRNRGRVDSWYNPNLSLEDEHFRVRPYHAPVLLKRPVRAIMATHNLNHEGAPICMLEMVVGLKKRGVLEAVVMSPVDGPLRAQYEAAGVLVRIVRHPLADDGTETAFDKRLDELAAMFRGMAADVVYGNTLLTFWAIAAGERAGLPTIWNPRESEPWQTYFDFLNPALRKRAYSCFAFPYRVVFVANATRRAWSPLESRFNFAVVHDGLDRDSFEARLAGTDRAQARRFLGVGPDEVATILVGTVCERKGQIDLVRALREMQPETAERMRAFIVGDRASPYSSQLQVEIEKLPSGLRKRLSVIRETAEVAPYYRAADIALCTSRIESYPRIVLEGMACGLPIVATPVFGIREQVREKINGLFYEPGDTRALAAALTRLGQSDTLRLQLGRNSLLVLDSLTSCPEMLNQYGDIFREAMYSKGRVYSPHSRQGTS